MMLPLLFAATVTTSPVAALAENYLNSLYRSSPMTASALGYHQNGVDRHLDAKDAKTRRERRAELQGMMKQIASFKIANLDGEARADLQLMESAIALEAFGLDDDFDRSRRCDRPVEELGQVFFNMAVRDYAPLETRATDVLARLDEVPRYLAEAQSELRYNVDIFRQAAREEGDGLVDYLQKDLPQSFAQSRQSATVAQAGQKAATAVRRYLDFVDQQLAKQPSASFRNGAERYARRFGPYLQTELSPQAVLAAAEKRAAELRQLINQAAKQILPTGDVRAAFAVVADDHPSAVELFAAVKTELAELTRFVRQQQLVSLSPKDNLTVIETPAFLRSVLAVAAFDGAPPLQPQLGAFYYVTPFSSDWPNAKIENKLREYNRSMLAILTMHEAMPGHYVQFESANRLQPEWRRVLRWALGSNAYIEGWAMYAQEMMIEAGYKRHDPKLKLTEYKSELRAVTNTILDIKLQTTELSDAAAINLLTDAFQEQQEAELKLRRAKLSVTQLCSYFVGMQAWRGVREAVEKNEGRRFNRRNFHDRALLEGAVPLGLLPGLLGAPAAQ